ncbi:pentatricopeptide repeat-containing protein [Tanacetum coccineum]
MHDEFEMSMMGELNFFLGLQIKQMEDGIFFNQSKYIKEMLKKFGLEDSKPMKTPMSSDTKLTKDEECELVDSTKYRGMIGFAYIDKVTMPRATALDHQKTRNYIPSISNDFNQITIRNTMANLEKRYFHEGRVVSPNFENMSHIRAKFRSINFDCLLDINEQIVPRFVLEFYCQLTFTNNSNGQFVVNFVIQNKPFSLTLEEFGQILKIPFKGQASITEMWSLDHLSVSVPTKGLYKTKPPTPRVIKSHIQIPRQGQETRTKNKETIVVGENEILTREIRTHMKPWVEIIRENVFCQGGHKDHVSALFKHVVLVSPELAFDHYLSYDRVMYPLAPPYERKLRADRGKKRPCESNASSSSNTQNPPSSSLQIDDIVEDNDNESYHSNLSSPSQNVSSSSHNVSRVNQNPPHENFDLNNLLSKTMIFQT